MQRSRAFSLVELMIVVAIIGILVSLLIVQYGGQQQNARDANRRDSLRGYQTALEQYRIARGTYYVVYGPASSPQAAGNGSGWGPMTLANPTTGFSLAEALLQDGYLATIQVDPSHDGRDFQLTLCTATQVAVAAGDPNAATLATEYSLTAKIEGVNADTTTDGSSKMCNQNYIKTAFTGTFNANKEFSVGSRRW